MDKYSMAIKKYFGDSNIGVRKMYDGGKEYLFSIYRKDNPKEELLDPWYTISKKDLVIKGFQPHENIEYFNRAISR